MKDFFIKTIKLWGAIICFAIAICLFYFLCDFFSNGGGLIRVKGLIAPIIFILFGLSLLLSFVKQGIKQGNRYYAIIAVLIVILIGGGFWFFSTSNYQNQKIYNNIMNGSSTNVEALAGVSQLLCEHDKEATSKAIECLEYLNSKGVKEATYKLGEIYFTDDYDSKDYNKAFVYLENAREKYEISEAQKGDLLDLGNYDLGHIYEDLGDIYSEGLNGEVNEDKALNYYRLALKNSLAIHHSGIERKINNISLSHRESGSDN